MDNTLFVSDLDGTLLSPDGHLSQTTADIINHLIGQGMLFTLATARSVVSAGECFEKLHLQCPCILMNGTFLYNSASRQFVKAHQIPAGADKKVIEIYERAGRLPYKYGFDGSEISIQYRQTYHEYDDLFIAARKPKYRSFERVEQYSYENPTVFINALDRYETLAPVYKELCQIESLTNVFYKDSYYDGIWFCESFSSQASKANAIGELKKMLGVSKVVVFGDNYNDLSMFRAADEGIAVKGAVEELKELATEVIDGNEEDAVARYLLKRLGK